MSLTVRATIHRPSSMEGFAEMINMFIMICSGLGVMSVLVLTDFFEHAVYDTIRLRGRTWKLAHELMLIMFRRVEDSGGRLSLAKICDECHLGTLLEEAEVNRASEVFRDQHKNMEAINAALRKIKYRGEQKLTQYLLTEEDMTRISTVNRFLTKLDIFSTTLGGDQYVTSSVLLPVIAAQAQAPRQSVCSAGWASC